MARKGIFMVLSRPASPEQEAEYNRWYEENHVPDSLLLPGFVRGRRYRVADTQLLPGRATESGFDYLAVYDVEDIDLIGEAQARLPKLAEISAEFMSPAMDPTSVRAFVYEEIADITEPTAVPDGFEL